MKDHVPKLLKEARILEGPLKSTREYGLTGAFIFSLGSTKSVNIPKSWDRAQVISDNGRGEKDQVKTNWEHVSVTIINTRDKTTTPNWFVMSKIKSLFWKESETVLQYHPAEEDYVDMHSDVLHLWRPIKEDIPKPPTDLIGPNELT